MASFVGKMNISDVRVSFFMNHTHYAVTRVRPRFFDQVRYKTMYASSGNKYFFTKSCHCQTYQNYEQSRQKLGTILENKVS